MNINTKQKRTLFVVAALALVVIIAISAIIINVLSPKKTPVSSEYITVTVDGEISASFTLKPDDYTVISSQTYNKAHMHIVQHIAPSVSFTQAMDTFVASLLDAKKLSGKETEVLLFGVESRNESDFEALAGYFRDVLKKNECSTRVYSLYTKVKTEKTQNLAEENEVSYAKAQLCTRLEKENKKLKAEDLITLSLTEIVEKVNGIAMEDLVGKVESDTNEEQKNESIPNKEPSTPSTPSSEISSDSSLSSDSSSSDSSSSEESSSSTAPSFVVEPDESGWGPIR